MKYLSVFLIAVIALSSCNIIDQKRIKGNGHVISKTYDLKDFAQIDIGDNMDVYIQQGTDYSVKIETDENLFKYLDVNVHDNKSLEVDVTNNTNLDATGEVKVYITAPWLDKVDISGAAQLQTRGKFTQDRKIKFDLSGASSGNVSVRAPVVELEASGASTLTADGESRDVKANASGASTINAFNLMAEKTDADASGASTVRVFSSIALKAKANGASTIKYKGNPQVTSEAGGAGSVSKGD
ncbi:MAG TPA: head GIN domain-containing protein [Niabella sp.]|nr:head GIN domain-containing protein [Niabella sp.]